MLSDDMGKNQNILMAQFCCFESSKHSLVFIVCANLASSTEQFTHKNTTGIAKLARELMRELTVK